MRQSCRRLFEDTSVLVRGYEGFYDLRGDIVLAPPFRHEVEALVEHELIHVNVVNMSSLGRLEKLAACVWDADHAKPDSWLFEHLLQPLSQATEMVHETVAWAATCTWDGAPSLESVPAEYQFHARRMGEMVALWESVSSRPEALARLEDLAIEAMSPPVVGDIWKHPELLLHVGIRELLSRSGQDPLTRLESLLAERISGSIVLERTRIGDLGKSETHDLACSMARANGGPDLDLHGVELLWRLDELLNTFCPDVDKYCQVSILGRPPAFISSPAEPAHARPEDVYGVTIRAGRLQDDGEVWAGHAADPARVSIVSNRGTSTTDCQLSDLAATINAFADSGLPVVVDASSHWAHYSKVWNSCSYPRAVLSYNTVRGLCRRLLLQTTEGGSTGFEYALLGESNLAPEVQYLVFRPVLPEVQFVVILPIIGRRFDSAEDYLMRGVYADRGFRAIANASGSTVAFRPKPFSKVTNYSDPWLADFAASVRLVVATTYFGLPEIERRR